MDEQRAGHVMIDIETLSSHPDAAILSIGAVRCNADWEFSPNQPFREFYANVTLQSCLDWGLKIEGRTFYWWLAQHPHAQKALSEPAPESLELVLMKLTHWLAWDNIPGAGYKTEEYVWSHGNTFDQPILHFAHQRIGREIPWHYRKSRDTRTLFWLVHEFMGKVKVKPSEKHHALTDAYRQMKHVALAVKVLDGLNQDALRWEESCRAKKDVTILELTPTPSAGLSS